MKQVALLELKLIADGKIFNFVETSVYANDALDLESDVAEQEKHIVLY